MYNLGSNQMHEGIKLFIFEGNCFSGGNEPKNGGGMKKLRDVQQRAKETSFCKLIANFRKKE